MNYATGPIKFGIQRKFHDEGQTVSTTDAVFYKDLAIGLAYTVNDSPIYIFLTDIHPKDTILVLQTQSKKLMHLTSDTL